MKHLFQNQARSPLISTLKCSCRPCFILTLGKPTKPAKGTRVAQFDIRVSRTYAKLKQDLLLVVVFNSACDLSNFTLTSCPNKLTCVVFYMLKKKRGRGSSSSQVYLQFYLPSVFCVVSSADTLMCSNTPWSLTTESSSIVV